MSKCLLGFVQAVVAVAIVHASVLALRGDRGPAAARPVDDWGGAIREVAVHFDPASGFVRDAYRDFFDSLPEEVRIRVVCARPEDRDEFVRRFGREAEAVVVGRPITTWARDRFVACEDAVLIVPPEPHIGPPARRNDWHAPFALAKAMGGEARKAPFRFDGGDFCAVDGRILAGRAWVERNPEITPERLVREAEKLFGRPVVLLPDAPLHHIGMILAPVGGDHVLVGETDGDSAPRFDAVAETLVRAGFRVDRIPVVITERDFAWLSYTNAIFDGNAVYMPVYDRPELDRKATEVYRRLGLEVRPVDVSGIFEQGGALRCLVQVMRRARS